MATNKPKIVGPYGVPGSGKTYLKDELKISLDENQYAFYDGSEILALVTDGSLDSFKAITRTGEVSSTRSRHQKDSVAMCSKWNIRRRYRTSDVLGRGGGRTNLD